jgi:hypothetical protein
MLTLLFGVRAGEKQKVPLATAGFPDFNPPV